MGENDKTTKKPPAKEGEEPLPEEKEDEMGKTMMDIDVSELTKKDKEGAADSSEESVDDLLKKKKSLKNLLGLGKIFGKKD